MWLFVLSGLANVFAYSQDDITNIDPRLFEVVQAVKEITSYQDDKALRATTVTSEDELMAEKRLAAVTQMKSGAIAHDPDAIRSSIRTLQGLSLYDSEVSFSKVLSLYANHANLIESDASRNEYFENIDNIAKDGSWLEKFSALNLAEILHSENGERNAAMQKAQMAFALIPQGEDASPYSRYAMAEATNTLSKLHNIQGNVDLALETSLAYLSLPKAKTNPRAAVDIVNNLIFSHSLKRDHESLVYLSKAVLEIENTNPSSLPGLSEFRISQAMNASVQFEKALKYSDNALDKIEHLGIKKQAAINRAIALAGLGRTAEAKRFAEDSGINLNTDYLLNTETRRDALYLGFLLAQNEDKELATALYNRQLDVTSQKFLENNSCDTTAMPVSYTHLRAHETVLDLVCRLLLEKKKK